MHQHDQRSLQDHHHDLLDLDTAALPYQAVHIHLGNPTERDMYLPVLADIENQVVLFHSSNAYLYGHAHGPGGSH
ncbi:hypothetical protein CLH62_06235 [Marinobacter guineae]|uniref:Uncharacterized protein n=1 Tax=Marinobacter guineae TaxID=432303 RepID=A0A2G1VKQ2_9GAMM|nr:hypothetical protein CLH62_06235 [Marinobacter guineae]